MSVPGTIAKLQAAPGNLAQGSAVAADPHLTAVGHICDHRAGGCPRTMPPEAETRTGADMRTRSRPHRLAGVVVAALATITAVLAIGVSPAHALPIEDAFTATGSSTVVYGDAAGAPRSPCAAGTPAPGAYTIVYPTPLGQSGDNPIVVFGSGYNTSDADPVCHYDPYLRHLASWGFVVVAPNDGTVGNGSEMVAAVSHMVALDGNPSSVFYGKLDTTRIAAVGHSQGADGAVNASIASGGAIDSTVPIAMIDSWITRTDPPYPVPNTAQLTRPVFFVRGSGDLIATEESYDGSGPVRGNREFYQDVPGAAAKATRQGSDHLNIVWNSRGYVTAWLLYTLQGNVIAAAAFTGSSPEIAGNGAWTNWQAKNLP